MLARLEQQPNRVIEAIRQAGVLFDRAVFEHTPICPKRILEKMAQGPRPIEKCWWAEPVQIDFDGRPQDPLHQIFIKEFDQSMRRQVIKGQHHPLPQTPGKNSDMIIGFCDSVPNLGKINIKRMMADKDLQLEPMLVQIANEKYFDKTEKENVLKKNYTVVVTIDEDITKMSKREAEETVRMLMSRLGALKVIMIYPQKDGTNADYYALGTMEGGLVVEYTHKSGYMDRFRDRLVTHARAKESGTFQLVKDVISKKDWNRVRVPGYVAATSQQLAAWGYIARPFSAYNVANRRRGRSIEQLMHWSGARQSESAIAALEVYLQVLQQYRMGNVNGVIISSRTGRWNEIDKTVLDKNQTIAVSIVPKPDYHPDPNDPLALNGFERYALGLEGESEEEMGGPSIEFDEMSAAMTYSGVVRVSPHPCGIGFKLDPEGSIVMPRVRGFVHIHQGMEIILPKMIPLYDMSGKKWVKGNAKVMAQYIRPNFKDYPFGVGCGKDIMFATSTDAARRSSAVHYRDNDPNYLLPPGPQVAFFDALFHGSNGLVLTEPLPDSDWIPDNPFYAFLPIVQPYYGGVQFSNELGRS